MSTEKQKIDTHIDVFYADIVQIIQKHRVCHIYLLRFFLMCENNFKAYTHIIHSYIQTYSVYLYSSHKEFDTVFIYR